MEAASSPRPASSTRRRGWAGLGRTAAVSTSTSRGASAARSKSASRARSPRTPRTRLGSRRPKAGLLDQGGEAPVGLGPGAGRARADERPAAADRAVEAGAAADRVEDPQILAEAGPDLVQHLGVVAVAGVEHGRQHAEDLEARVGPALHLADGLEQLGNP